MENKQIIIDGVNVAGCEYFNRFRNICHNKNLCCDCEKNQDCHYKQLKRKEQECKRLKEALDEIKNIAGEDFNHTCWATYARQLKQILQKISEYKGEYNEKIR